MRMLEVQPHPRPAAGFTLPAILVVTGALLILAVGILLVAGIERSTARSFVDRQRADLAARAGLEDIRGILNLEATNDDYLVIQSNAARPMDDQKPDRQRASFLFLARGRSAGESHTYRYIPLFSAKSNPLDSALAAPAVEPLIGSSDNERIDFETLPYQDKVAAAWLPLKDEMGRTVARYAYWVEDLQARIDPHVAGNDHGPSGAHAREVYPFPAPGLDDPNTGDPDDAALSQIALYALDPASACDQQGNIGKMLFKNRAMLVSPDSSLAAAGIAPRLVRLERTEPPDPGYPGVFGRPGQLVDRAARAIEENTAPVLRSYAEMPMVPYSNGIDPAVAGRPKLNLNKLVATGGDAAVSEMAGFIKKGLPRFDDKTHGRPGGFPEDYLKTLAANAIDYADEDKDSTFRAKEYRGLDAFPLLSEVVLQISYEGIANLNDRKILRFRMRLFAELFNPTNHPVEGDARLSYEVSLPVDGIGSGIGEVPFDAPELLTNPERSTHDLDLIAGRYWTKPKTIHLGPNQYQAHVFAEVFYQIDIGSSSEWFPGSTPFSLREERGVSGLSLRWRGREVDRVSGLVRQEGLIVNNEGSHGFRVGTPKVSGKASLPGHVHDNFWPSMHYNMGDQRITYYLRESPAAENAYPNNISPNRRNIRLNIYNGDASNRPKVYARVLPSEWPDGGHNAAVGTWTTGSSDATLFDDPKFNFAYDAKMEFSAPQRISNKGGFYSATELGRVFDPIMYAPMFVEETETNSLVKDGKMPASRSSWPDAISGQGSKFYGGGNTLRIGRPEHPAFDLASDRGIHAARLLDLFHAGMSPSDSREQREGNLIRIDGHVNVNTAPRDAIRTLAAGLLCMDPALAKQTNSSHSGAPVMAPPTTAIKLSAPTLAAEADRIADAVVLNRPYASPSELASIRAADGTAVFGNRDVYQDGRKIEWADAAAEEVFARVYESSTVRSRNFRIWVLAQAISPTMNTSAKPEVLAEVRRSFCLFADPGERLPDGKVDAMRFRTLITHSNDF